MKLYFSSILILYQVLCSCAETPNDDVDSVNTTLLSVYNTTKLLRETIDTLQVSIDALTDTNNFLSKDNLTVSKSKKYAITFYVPDYLSNEVNYLKQNYNYFLNRFYPFTNTYYSNGFYGLAASHASNAIEHAKQSLRVANENLNRQLEMLNKQKVMYNPNIENARKTVESAIHNVNANQLMLLNMKSRFGREFVISGGGNYYYDGKDFYDRVTNEKMKEGKANELKTDIKQKIDKSLNQVSQAQFQTQNLMKKWF